MLAEVLADVLGGVLMCNLNLKFVCKCICWYVSRSVTWRDDDVIGCTPISRITIALIFNSKI